MAQIQPFKGFRYNTPHAGDIQALVTQPYDTISPDMQDRYYQSSEYNIVRIIKGKAFENDTHNNNQYSRANDFFKTWVQAGIIIQDDEPAIYVYEQQYRLPGGAVKFRLGYIALCKLESLESGIVFPHEQTHSKPKEDRYRLLTATQVHWGQIFMLYSDPANSINAILKKQIESLEPLYDFSAEDEIRNRVWRVTATAAIAQVQQLMANKSILIADGHHRYETALKFKEAHPELPSAQHVMITLVNMDDPGLSVLPTHRLLKPLPADNQAAFRNKANEIFNIKKFPLSEKDRFLAELTGQGQQTNTFGFYNGENFFYTFAVKSSEIRNKFFKSADQKHLKDLDVAVFDELVIKYALGIETGKEKYIAYSKDINETIRLVDSSEYKYAFFLNPTKMTQISAITSTGQRMPQKSTYFYPKLISGLIFYKL